MIKENTCTEKNRVVDVLSNAILADIATKEVITAYEGWSIKTLSKFFYDGEISGAPVVSADNELVGVVTKSDVICFESKSLDFEAVQDIIDKYIGPFTDNRQAMVDQIRDRASEYCCVHAIMTPRVHALDVSASLLEAVTLIKAHNIHRLFVTDQDELSSVVTAEDILSFLLSSE
ncbi:CBS domain-containing protein [Ningiella sp. W23]|uniref:CBS domain-containing protein n=1 Tax=Ningiella sp. W23 TaxID=3023715 RepID=UPI0037564B5D